MVCGRGCSVAFKERNPPIKCNLETAALTAHYATGYKLRTHTKCLPWRLSQIWSLFWLIRQAAVNGRGNALFLQTHKRQLRNCLQLAEKSTSNGRRIHAAPMGLDFNSAFYIICAAIWIVWESHQLRSRYSPYCLLPPSPWRCLLTKLPWKPVSRSSSKYQQKKLFQECNCAELHNNFNRYYRLCNPNQDIGCLVANSLLQ